MSNSDIRPYRDGRSEEFWFAHPHSFAIGYEQKAYYDADGRLHLIPDTLRKIEPKPGQAPPMDPATRRFLGLDG